MYIFHTVAVTDVLSRTIRFTLTGFTTQSHPQFIHTTTAKIIVALTHLHVTFFLVLSWVCQGGICEQNKTKQNKTKQKKTQ